MPISNCFGSQVAVTSVLLVLGIIFDTSQSLLHEYWHHSKPLHSSYQRLDWGDSKHFTFLSNRLETSLGIASDGYDSVEAGSRVEGDPHVETVLFVECGFGNDSHGQSATKAAVRACRNSIEFNSIPSVSRLIPNGYQGLKLDVLLAVPPKYKDSLDLSEVQKVFPYGSVRFQIQDGGMVAPSGIAIEKLGDQNEDMVVVCAAVTVGY